MANKEILTFIEDSRKAGKDTEYIKKQLLKVGWTQEQIQEALSIPRPLAYQASGTIYPQLAIDLPTSFNVVLGLPVLGFFIKIILIIPVALVIAFYSIGAFFLSLVHPFYILVKGKVWPVAFRLHLNIFKLQTKQMAYLYGLTDTYPGFNFQLPANIRVEMPTSTSASRLLGFPLLGLVFRLFLMIPFLFFQNLLQNAAFLGYLAASFVVTTKKKYPEAFYEIVTDNMRVVLSSSAYFGYLTDKYPSFQISMNHKKVKIILLVLALILSLLNVADTITTAVSDNENFQEVFNSQ